MRRNGRRCVGHCLQVLAGALLLLASCKSGPSGSAGMVQNLQVPPTARIREPGLDVPAALAAFSGVWGGRWHGVSYGQDWSVDSLVIVERISANGDVQGAYVLGDAPPYQRAGSWKFAGKIVDGKLTWVWNKNRFVYSMDGNGILSGRRYVSDVQDSSQIMMRKMSGIATDSQPPSFLSAIVVAALDPAITPELAVFNGKWEGVTGDGRQRVMVVDQITPAGDAAVIHAWDDVTRPEGFRPWGYAGRIHNGVLVFSGGGDTYQFTKASDGTLSGIMVRNGAEHSAGVITMTTVSIDLSQPRPKHWLVGLWKGSIAGYTPPEGPARTLNVAGVADGGIATAAWGLQTARNFGSTNVTVNGDNVTVTTSANSRVELRRDGNQLVGTFTLVNGRAYEVVLSRIE